MSRAIGVAVPTTDNSFFGALAEYLDRGLRERGLSAVVVSCGNDVQRERDGLAALVGLGVKGLVCVSGLSELPGGLVPDDLPLVWVDRVPRAARAVPWVANDDAEAMERAVTLLIQKGCRDVLLMPGYLPEGQESPRVVGYRRALEAKGIILDPSRILRRQSLGSSEAETASLVRAWVESGRPLDGIVTSSDRAAFGATCALRTLGRYVPEDVRLVSFDNSPYAAMADPPITALDRKPALLARRACEVLLAQIEGHPYDVANVIPVDLIERTSTR